MDKTLEPDTMGSQNLCRNDKRGMCEGLCFLISRVSFLLFGYVLDESHCAWKKTWLELSLFTFFGPHGFASKTAFWSRVFFVIVENHHPTALGTLPFTSVIARLLTLNKRTCFVFRGV